ncbi:MAG: OmpA family protein [Prevotellaceae bacterium]|jgi:outer membrane protein OmpA-like peptidoglycan-associated protein|nr:OmpA family protein [Prevotellaceae bacterium]
MKIIKHIAIYLLGASIISMTACSNMSNTSKGTAIGAGSGAAVGAGVGAITGKGKGAAIGAGIGAVLGGVAGALIGKKMDKQAEELKQQVEGAEVETVNNGEAIKLTFDSGILFATGKADLSEASKISLAKFAVSLQQNPNTDVTIEGHTDNTGSDSVNQPLSENRARSVYSFLAAQGVNSQRMHTVGYSSYRPVADNSTADGRSKNRRVEVYITANQQMIEQAHAGTLK